MVAALVAHGTFPLILRTSMIREQPAILSLFAMTATDVPLSVDLHRGLNYRGQSRSLERLRSSIKCVFRGVYAALDTI